jgi:hypothetical protein
LESRTNIASAISSISQEKLIFMDFWLQNSYQCPYMDNISARRSDSYSTEDKNLADKPNAIMIVLSDCVDQSIY